MTSIFKTLKNKNTRYLRFGIIYVQKSSSLFCPIENSPNIKLHCYRAIMEVFIRHIDPSLVLAAIRCKKIKNASSMEFEEYDILYSLKIFYLSIYPSLYLERGMLIFPWKRMVDTVDSFSLEIYSPYL